ncbi:uncharacterized protein LOC144002887 isoform X5 [Festucalex cinctus]
MCSRKTVKYEEELRGTEEEIERERQMLDDVCKRPPVMLPGADVIEKHLGPDIKEESSSSSSALHVKQESQQPHIKEEEDFTEYPVTGVHLKTEDDGQCDENKGAEPPSSSSSRRVKTEGGGEHCDGSQADSLLAPLSDSDDIASDSPDTDDDDDDDEQSEDISEKCLDPAQQDPEPPDVRDEGPEHLYIQEEEQMHLRHVKKEEEEREDDIIEMLLTGVPLKSEDEDIEKCLRPDIQEAAASEALHVQEEEPQPPYIKEEGEFTDLPVTGVHLKTEDASHYEDNKGAKSSSSSSSQHMTTEIDDEHPQDSQADGWLAPMSDSDDTSHSHHTDDNEQSEGSFFDRKRWRAGSGWMDG